MSNNTNLSKLANVLDDGSSGQFLKSTGSGGVVFDTVAAGTTTVADITALEALSAAQGDMAFVLSNDNVYIRKTAGWYKIAQVTNNQLESVTVTMSGGGTAGDPYLLALDGTDTLATGAATDPEGLSVTWSAAAISPATLSGNNIVVSSTNVATITQGTGASSNVFTIDPVATTGTYNFSLRFSVTDGVNATINADKSYTLNFITTVADSKYTVMLAQAVGANNGTNSSLTDSSSNNSTLTNTGTPVANTFSPYRGGGYSAYFTGVAGDKLTVSNQGSNWSDTGTVTIEFWFNSTGGNGLGAFWKGAQSYVPARFDINSSNNNLEFYSWTDGNGNGYNWGTIKTALTSNTWYHLAAVKNGRVWKFYLNGTLELTYTHGYNYNYGSSGSTHEIGQTVSNLSFHGYITDVRVNSNEVYTAAFPNSVPTERLTADSNTTFFYNGTGYIGDTHSSTASNNESITIGGDTAIKPVIPYDYSEYDAADNGGSIYFDGSSGASFSQINLSSTYTVECWFYTTSTDTWQTLFWTASPFNQFIARWTSSGVELQYYTKITHQTKTALNTWNHAALVSDGTDVYVYLNGERSTNSVAASSNSFSVNYLGYRNNGEEFTGYIADARVTDGTAVYSGASFTPPAAPLSSSGADIHIKGTDASVRDKSGSAALKLYGGAVSSTAVSGKFSNTNVIKVTGTSDYFTPTYSPVIGTNDYTIECWLHETIRQNYSYLFDYRPPNNNGDYLSLRLEQAQYNLYVGSSHTNRIVGGSSTWNGWAHFALARSGNQTKMFSNGTQVGNTWNATTNLLVPDNTPAIGRTNHNTYSDNAFRGYIQDFRITVGKARYTSNFSVPTAPLEG